jgi:hypothetical protein
MVMAMMEWSLIQEDDLPPKNSLPSCLFIKDNIALKYRYRMWATCASAGMIGKSLLFTCVALWNDSIELAIELVIFTLNKH